MTQFPPFFSIFCIKMSQDQNNSDIDIDIESPDQSCEKIDLMAEEEPTTPVPTDSVEPEAAKTSDNTVEMSKETRKLRKKKVFHSDDESTAKTAKGKPTQSGGNKHAFPEVKSEVKVKEEEETVTSPAVMEDVESSPKRVKLSLSEILDSGHLEITDEQLDDIDTDNLVEEVSRLPLLRKSLTNRKRRKAADKKSRSSSKKLAIVKSEIIKKVCCNSNRIRQIF